MFVVTFNSPDIVWNFLYKVWHLKKFKEKQPQYLQMVILGNLQKLLRLGTEWQKTQDWSVLSLEEVPQEMTDLEHAQPVASNSWKITSGSWLDLPAETTARTESPQSLQQGTQFEEMF